MNILLLVLFCIIIKFIYHYYYDYKNANHFNYDSTQIILINGQIEQAHELAELMDINLSQVHTESLEKIENLILVIGKDYEKLNSFFKIEWTTP